MSALQPFRRHVGVAAPLPVDNVDTDTIFPAHWIRRMDADYAGALFANWRFLDGEGDPDPDFVLNRTPYRRASILVTGDNFGCGSSREHAVWALKSWGIRAILARSLGDIFEGNCFKNGLLAVALDASAHSEVLSAAQAASGADFVVDLEACRIEPANGRSVRFEIAEGRRYQLLNGLDEIGVTLEETDAIDAFQERHREEQPWVWSALEAERAKTS